MSIITLEKVTLCGLAPDKEAVLEGLQKLGCMHLVSLRPALKEPETAAPARADDVYKALRYLVDTPFKRRQSQDDLTFDVEQVTAQVLDCKRRIRNTEDRRDFLAQRIEQLEPWGDFPFPSEEDLAGLKLWFYSIPHHQMRQIQSADLPWQVVHKDQRFSYLVVVAREEPPAGTLPVPRTHTGGVPLSELRRQLDQAEIELEDLTAERQGLTRWIFLLRLNLARAEDNAVLKHATEQTLDSDGIFAVQGWLPSRDIKRVTQFAEDRNLALLVEAPGGDDAPPTLLENPEGLAGGQDMMSFYQTPAYQSWDPSLVVFFSFALFFAMILSDAGYAAVLGLALLYFWKRLGSSPASQRFRTMARALVIASVVWGMLSGGYFGVSPPENSLLGAFKIFDINDFDTMMRLSVFIGVVHLALANYAMAQQFWGKRTAYVPLGWISAMFGGYAMWLGSSGVALAPMLSTLGTLLLIGGLGMVFVFSSERTGQKPIDWLWRVLDGLKGLSGVTGIFGDVLSYMRLFALGLSSASLALTFNQLAAQVADAVPGIGFFFGLLILIVGHGLNVLLSLMSGVVHGLRLNFIEFFKWGLSEEGYPFRAFAKQEMKT